MAPREGVAIARGRGGRLLGLAAVVNLLWGPVRIRRLRPSPRAATLTELGNRLSDPRGTRPWIWAPVRQWPTLLWVVSALRPLMWLTTGRMITLARPLVTGLVTRGLPGPRMNRCLLFDLGVRLARWVPSLALATLSVVVARAMNPCRRLILCFLPNPLGGCFHGRLRWGRGHPSAWSRRDPP